MTSEFTRQAFASFGRLAPGSRIAGYLIEEQIGAGGMAVVFRARDEALGRLAAVKVIAPSIADNDEFRARFLRESRAAAAVNSLHIIPVYGAGQVEGLLYIATRFVAGGDLAKLVQRSGGRLAADRAVSFIAQVASALEAAHAAGLVHRDVKPQNILVDFVPERPEHAFLADFGLSKSTQSTDLTASGQFLGTPDYCAPEQIRGGQVDGRTDQYALACAAFFLITGMLPFHRDHTTATLFAHLQDPPPRLTELRPELPTAIDDVVATALAKSPGDRYTRCGEFAEALQKALVPARHATAPPIQAQPTQEDAPPISGAQFLREQHPSSIAEPSSKPPAPSLPPSSVTNFQGVEPQPQRGPDTAGWSQPSRIGSHGSEPPRTADRTAGPVPEAVQSPEPRSAEAGWPAHAAQERSFAGTINVDRVLPPGRSGPPTAQAAAASRPTCKPPRRVSRRRTGLIAAGTVTVAGLATAGTFMFINRPAPRLSAANTPPATRTPTATSSATATRQATALTATGKITAILPSHSASTAVDSDAFGPDGTLATADSNGNVYLWNTSTGKITATLTDPDRAPIESFAFGPDGTLAVGDDDGNTYLWNTTTRKVTTTLAVPTVKIVFSVAFGPDGTLAVGDGGDNVYLWNTTTRKVTTTLTASAGTPVYSIVFGSGGTLATSDTSGNTYLWNTSTDKITTTITVPDLAIETVALGPDGTLATGNSKSNNDSVHLWNTTTRKITATLPAPGNATVRSVAFGPDGTLATGDASGNTYLWNTSTDKIIATLTDPGGDLIHSVVFGPDGTLATGDTNGSTYLWHITYS